MVSLTTWAETLLVVRSLAPTKGNFTRRPAPCQLFTLGFFHVPAAAANIGLVHLHRNLKQSLGLLPQGTADTVRQVPGCLLRDAHFPVEFHARHALEIGGDEMVLSS